MINTNTMIWHRDLDYTYYEALNECIEQTWRLGIHFNTDTMDNNVSLVHGINVSECKAVITDSVIDIGSFPKDRAIRSPKQLEIHSTQHVQCCNFALCVDLYGLIILDVNFHPKSNSFSPPLFSL